MQVVDLNFIRDWNQAQCNAWINKVVADIDPEARQLFIDIIHEARARKVPMAVTVMLLCHAAGCGLGTMNAGHEGRTAAVMALAVGERAARLNAGVKAGHA